MYIKTLFLAATAALLAGQAMGAVLIAPDPVAACNCPNNCKHHLGSSCKFYSNGNVLSGVCQHDGSGLKCAV
ncbi:hypothetical protein GQ53DRAFT_828875 [Thozetella sp. PMI_491]|nr:hypothetical protein GQ53DRAFT_828875 [Thozetella sp. PMI_491]